jgi:hypothetical protein
MELSIPVDTLSHIFRDGRSRCARVTSSRSRTGKKLSGCCNAPPSSRFYYAINNMNQRIYSHMAIDPTITSTMMETVLRLNH